MKYTNLQDTLTPGDRLAVVAWMVRRYGGLAIDFVVFVLFRVFDEMVTYVLGWIVAVESIKRLSPDVTIPAEVMWGPFWLGIGAIFIYKCLFEWGWFRWRRR